MVRRKSKSKSAKKAIAGSRGMGMLKRKGNDAHREYSSKENESLKLKQAASIMSDTQDSLKDPHSFVFSRGTVGKYARRLVRDLRELMEPNTAKNLQVRKGNNIKDFVVNGAVLGVSHLMVVTRGEMALTLRFIRMTQGPTLTFRVKQYTLRRHIVSSQKRHMHYQRMYETAPLVVMNGFNSGGQKHLQLVQSMVQHMFPSINVDTLKLNAVKRVLMVNYNEEEDTIDFRHYAIKATVAGVSKSSKKLVTVKRTNKIPDLSKYNDISDYFLNPGAMSESEFEEEQKEVELTQDLSAKGCKTGQLSNLRLIECGPRMTLELLKIEEGIDEGEVLYNKYVTKTPEEIVQLRKKLPKIKREKERREKDEEHRVIRRLERVQAERDEEDKEVQSIIEKAARNQAQVTGQKEDVDYNPRRDKEAAADRERDEKETLKRAGGGDGQNGEPDAKKVKGGRVHEAKYEKMTRKERAKAKAADASTEREKQRKERAEKKEDNSGDRPRYEDFHGGMDKFGLGGRGGGRGGFGGRGRGAAGRGGGGFGRGGAGRGGFGGRGGGRGGRGGRH